MSCPILIPPHQIQLLDPIRHDLTRPHQRRKKSEEPLKQIFHFQLSTCYLLLKSEDCGSREIRTTKRLRSMDSLPSVSPSVVLPLRRHQYHHRRRQSALPWTRSRFLPQFTVSSDFRRRRMDLKVFCKLRGGGEDGKDVENDRRDDELERAMRMDGTIPRTPDAFVRQVSSRAYDMRRYLQQSFDSSSYDVLEANPWRETSKSVYVLTHQENQVCTMKTRRNRREVERELGLLFSKEAKWRSQSKQSETSTKFPMLVEDVQEGVLVFEDENEAAKYCDLLKGGGQNCEGVAEIEASSVFDLCQKNKALAVLFRRGRTPPVPENLKLNLRARKRSLEDQEDLV